jgi:hypothetical protein
VEKMKNITDHNKMTTKVAYKVRGFKSKMKFNPRLKFRERGKSFLLGRGPQQYQLRSYNRNHHNETKRPYGKKTSTHQK